MVDIKDNLGRNLYNIDEKGNEFNHSKYYYESLEKSSDEIIWFILTGLCAFIASIGIILFK